MDLNMQAIGTRIKTRRKALSLTQIDIKNAVGISSGNLSDIENGNRLPAATTLVQLASVLECSIDWILVGESPISENIIFSDIGDSAESELLLGFRKLSADDKEELLGILQMKLQRMQKTKRHSAQSSLSTDIDKNHMTG